MQTAFFALGDSHLLFIPTDEFRKCFITSVYVYNANPLKTSAQVDECFLAVQRTIHDLVLRLTTQHASKPFPQAAFPFLVEGKGYVLHFALKPWPYGKTIELAWGGITLIPTEDKWQIGFEVSG